MRDDEIGKILHFRLEDLRARLLNLGTNNKLISTKFSDRTRSHVRVIDELPGVLYEKLLKGVMTFKALPPLEEELADEKTDEFKSALFNARLTDERYLEGLIDLEEQGLGQDSEDFYELERELKDRLREALGLPPRQTGKRNPSLPEHARAHQLNPEYDLPKHEGGEPEERWLDSEMQLLLLPEQMDRTLSRIADQARTFIQESGIDTLYMVFGFLEWRDAPSSERSHYAPLVILPVGLQRERLHGRYKFRVGATGDDPEANITMAEKLKQDFGLALPELEEEDTPESYWYRIERDILTHKPDWRLRRWVAIGVFPFARMAMYHDLDPANWDATTKPLVSQILGGSEAKEDDLGSDYDVDDPEIEQLTPVLIADVDSSQHRAVIDMVKGRNMVIKGPPGTGKSQTIANIIGAALHEGQSVLFVAEKMAALEVVYNRLTEAGLGEFCLELHSHKARRKEVLESFRQRLELDRQTPPSELETERKRLQQSKKTLNRYVEALKRPYGETGLSVQQLLWSGRQADDAIELPDTLKRLRIENPTEIDKRTLERAQGLMNTLAEAHEACFTDGLEPGNHPWRGFGREVTTAFDLEDLQEEANVWDSAAAEALARAEDFAQRFHGPENASAFDWENVATKLVRVVELLEEEARPEIIQRLGEAGARRDLAEGIAALDRIEVLDGEFAGVLDPEKADLDLMEKAADLVARLEIQDLVVGEVTEARERAGAAQGELQRSIEATKGCAAQLGWDEALSHGDVALLEDAFSLVAEAPHQILRLRTRGMQEPACLELLEEARDRARGLRQKREYLADHYRLEAAGDPEMLESHAARLAEGGTLAFLSGAYRQARNAYRSIARERGKIDGPGMAQVLRNLAAHIRDCSTFAQDPRLQSILGARFDGIDTDFAQLIATVRFVKDVGRQFRKNEGFEGRLRQALLETDAELLVELTGPEVRARINIVAEQGRELDPSEAVAALEERARLRVADFETLLKTIQGIPSLEEGVALGDLDDLLVTIRERRKLMDEITNGPLSSLLPEELRLGAATPPRPLRQSLEAAEQIISLPRGMASMVFANPEVAIDAVTSVEAVVHGLEKVFHSYERIAHEAVLKVDEFFDGDTPRDIPLESLAARASACASTEQGLQRIAAWTKARSDCRTAGLDKVIEIGLEAGVSPWRLYEAYLAVVRRCQMRDALEADGGALQEFSGVDQARERESFQEADRRLRDLVRQKLRSDLLARVVPRGVGYGRKSEFTELSLIENEVHKQRRHIPLRDLFARATAAAQALKPCFLMSPQSVAQYLPRDRIAFDLLVIDEASQMKPEEAIGAFARVNQAIVVGDEKQLPPTNFFERTLAADIEDEDYAEERVAEESILEKALTVFRPARELRWHYRSRHSGLIAFSNRQFYDDRLITFPSAHEGDDRYGVKYVKVGGLYGGGTNPDEVQAIVEAAIEHMRVRPNDSLGLAAMNLPQRELILEELDRAISLDASARRYVTRWKDERGGIEPLFIKNLENVQGDERDVIMISTVYGPAKPGVPVAQRFGPINGVNGHRRLNVLFTRAKKQTVVFSSMTASDIQADAKPHRGVKVFRDYLSYAATGVLEGGDSEPDRGPDSPFEEWIIERIEGMGCEAVPQVGVVGYFIDIGVRHPTWPHGYILGVECDGATYHSAASVRERDRLRQEVLEELGWSIYRIWSTDWFNDPVGETDKLRQSIKARLEELNVGTVVDLAESRS